MGVFDRLFPDRIFGHRLSDAAERRLKLVVARSEEAIVEAHVQNALLFVETLKGDLTFDRAIDTYIREMAIPEPLASTVATRALVGFSETLPPVLSADDLLEDRPALRLDDTGRGESNDPPVRRIG